MARPKKEKKDKYNNGLTVRFTDEQYKALLEMAAGFTLNDYIRIVLFKRNSTAFKPKADRDMIKEINKIGVLLNQMARVINSKGYTTAELNTFSSNMHKFNNVLKEIYTKLDR